MALLERLAKQGVGIVVSSQDMNFVQRIIDKVCLVEQGEIIAEFDKRQDEMIATSAIALFLSK